MGKNRLKKVERREFCKIISDMGKGIESCYLLFLSTQELGRIKRFAVANSEQTKEMNFQMMHRELVGPLV